MSGILGFVSCQRGTIDIDKLRRGLRLLRHRGPDEAGILLCDASGNRLLQGETSENPEVPSTLGLPENYGSAALACCRLKTEDPCDCGTQPIVSAGAQSFLACDGVIDNGAELRRDLERIGHYFRSRAATEVLLAALDEWGIDCLSRVAGTFSFVALDLRRQRLLVARDSFGTRPLYFLRQDGLYFSSQIRPLLELASVSPRINRGSLLRYLVHNVMDHGAETFFAGVEQVPPACYLEAALDHPTAIQVRGYRESSPVGTNLEFEKAGERVRELVIRSVRSQVTGKEHVGAALSGGFDSSFVAAALRQTNGGAPFQLFTCIPQLKQGGFSRSEEPWADLVAEKLQASLHKVRVGSEGLRDEIEPLINTQEEPFSSPVLFAHLQVLRAARECGVTLMLSGQGGDMLFTASSQHLLRRVLELLRRGRLGAASALLRSGRHVPQSGTTGLSYAAMRMVVPENLRLAARSFRPTLPDWLNQKWSGFDQVAPVSAGALPMLRFEDRNAGSCSMVNRMPLLTTELQDFAGSLPAEYLITPTHPMKAIEAEAMRGMVPDAVIARTERFGFPVPVREWLQESADWMNDRMAAIAQLPFLNESRVQEVWRSVSSGANHSLSAAFLVWRWFFLDCWLRCFNVKVD